MKKLKIVLDCDGVLADTVEKVLALYNREYGLNFTKEDIVCWDMSRVQKPGTSLTKYFSMNGFFRDLKVMDGAKEYARLLKEDGHELFVATASPVSGIADKMAWLSENFGFIPAKNIMFIERKDLICADVILDDGLHNLINSQCKHKVVFDQPWNRNYVGNDIVRVYSWAEFYDFVRRISGKEKALAV